MCRHYVGIVTILEGGEVRIGFYDRVGRDQPRGHPRVPKAPRGVPEVDPRRVIQDIFPSLTPDNDIVHQFKTSSAAGG